MQYKDSKDRKSDHDYNNKRKHSEDNNNRKDKDRYYDKRKKDRHHHHHKKEENNNTQQQEGWNSAWDRILFKKNDLFPVGSKEYNDFRGKRKVFN